MKCYIEYFEDTLHNIPVQIHYALIKNHRVMWILLINNYLSNLTHNTNKAQHNYSIIFKSQEKLVFDHIWEYI